MAKPLSSDNSTVNGLWVGNTLSNLELLTIKSFLAQGHHFRLWVYEPIVTPLPKGVEVADANRILPASSIFRYKETNAYGHGKGSVSGFSDVFRYKMLFDEGGWWVDMDVMCLKPLDFSEPYVFRNHHMLKVVGNVMKCPKGSELMLQCYQKASAQVTENNTDWHLPIQILNDQIAENGLEGYIKVGLSNHDKWDELKRFVIGNNNPPATCFFIHWMNEEWRSRGLNKNQVKVRSFLGRMMIAHELMPAEHSFWKLFKEELQYSKLGQQLSR